MAKQPPGVQAQDWESTWPSRLLSVFLTFPVKSLSNPAVSLHPHHKKSWRRCRSLLGLMQTPFQLVSSVPTFSLSIFPTVADYNSNENHSVGSYVPCGLKGLMCPASALPPCPAACPGLPPSHRGGFAHCDSGLPMPHPPPTPSSSMPVKLTLQILVHTFPRKPFLLLRLFWTSGALWASP